MANRQSLAPQIIKGDGRGDPALTKRFYGFDSRMVLGPSQNKDIKNGSRPCLHGTQDEVGTRTRNWCQFDVTGLVSMCAYDMLSQ